MGVPDAPRAGPLGFPGVVGLAVSEHACSFRALRRRGAGQEEVPQEDNRLGARCFCWSGAGTRAQDRGRGRFGLRLHKAPCKLPAAGASCPSRSPSFITRLRLDARLYEPVPSRKPGQIGRPLLKGKRLPTLAVVAGADWYGKGETVAGAPTPYLIRDPRGKFAPQALLCTDPAAEPARILSWFVLRWTMEVTFQEARRHLGVETQRQWSELAIQRTTSALLALFSLVTLLAHRRMARSMEAPRQATWYRANPIRPFPMRWRWCGGSCGRRGGGGFSHVGTRSGHGKSAAGVRGTLNRGALLRGVNRQSRAKSSKKCAPTLSQRHA